MPKSVKVAEYSFSARAQLNVRETVFSHLKWAVLLEKSQLKAVNYCLFTPFLRVWVVGCVTAGTFPPNTPNNLKSSLRVDVSYFLFLVLQVCCTENIKENRFSGRTFFDNQTCLIKFSTEINTSIQCYSIACREFFFWLALSNVQHIINIG